MEYEYTEEEEQELFMKHVVGEDRVLLNISRMLDRVYAAPEE